MARMPVIVVDEHGDDQTIHPCMGMLGARDCDESTMHGWSLVPCFFHLLSTVYSSSTWLLSCNLALSFTFFFTRLGIMLT